MRVLVLFFMLGIFFLPSIANGGDFGRFPARSYNDTVNVRVHDGDREPIHHTGPELSTGSFGSGCFPYGCGGIEGPFRNPNPDARKPENLTSCIYGVRGVLLYKREGKDCPLRYIDENTLRLGG